MQSHILGGMFVGYMAGVIFGPYKIGDYTTEIVQTGSIAAVVCGLFLPWQLTEYAGISVQAALLPSLFSPPCLSWHSLSSSSYPFASSQISSDGYLASVLSAAKEPTNPTNKLQKPTHPRRLFT